MICCCVSIGSESQTSSGPKGLFSRNVAPSSAIESMSSFSTNTVWWQATKFALLTRYEPLIGRGLNRRCETVTEPAFFES